MKKPAGVGGQSPQGGALPRYAFLRIIQNRYRYRVDSRNRHLEILLNIMRSDFRINRDDLPFTIK